MPGSGNQGRHIARSTLAQQLTQVYAALAMLAVITVVGRTLELVEFGLYGLLISVSAYVLFLQASVSGAAVRAIASTAATEARDRAFSAALAMYVVAGVAAGLVIALIGFVLATVLDLPADLRDDARLAVAALAVATALGWPAKVFEDGLRGTQRFIPASVAQIVAYTAMVAGMVALVELDAPVWAMIALGGALPVLSGLAAGPILIATGAAPRFRLALLDRSAVRELLGVSGYLSSIGLADVVISLLDRVILAAFRSTATVGLYEGAARPNVLVRHLHTTLGLTVVPVASGYIAAGDQARLHELLLLGTRYVMAVVVPITVVLMTLGDRILDVWLGPEFAPAGPAMAILLSYWLVQSGTGVAGSMLVSAGALRGLNRYAWLVAGTNLALSLALTPVLGLEGVVIGTAVPYFLFLPYFLRLVVRTFAVPFDQLARRAWVPAYATGALVAGVAAVMRLMAPLESVGGVLVTAASALAVGWAVYFLAWMRPHERQLMRSVLR